MSGHAAVSHRPTHTVDVPPDQPPAPLPSQRSQSVPPRCLTARSQIWSPAHQGPPWHKASVPHLPDRRHQHGRGPQASRSRPRSCTTSTGSTTTGCLRSTATFRLQEADALDAIQMTWTRLAENAHRVQFPERLGEWLATTARRECLHILRQGKLGSIFTDVAPEPASDPSVAPSSAPSTLTPHGRCGSSSTSCHRAGGP
jgi:hypothetical protein